MEIIIKTRERMNPVKDPKVAANKKNKNATDKKMHKIINTMNKNAHIPSDVLGSYTGKNTDSGAPEQDADDL